MLRRKLADAIREVLELETCELQVIDLYNLFIIFKWLFINFYDYMLWKVITYIWCLLISFLNVRYTWRSETTSHTNRQYILPSSMWEGCHGLESLGLTNWLFWGTTCSIFKPHYKQLSEFSYRMWQVAFDSSVLQRSCV